jgi:hypothetical protein
MLWRAELRIAASGHSRHGRLVKTRSVAEAATISNEGDDRTRGLQLQNRLPSRF